MRIYTVSDLHIDHSENYQWLRDLSAYDFTEDLLILAGDLTDKRSLLETAFKILAKRFHGVFFVPGNHDLWVLRQNSKNSLNSFHEILEIINDYGIINEPRKYGSICIVPLLGWYDFSFGRPLKALCDTWVDFRACVWPADYDHQKITAHFIAMNEKHLNIRSDRMITFSHFLPRIDLMPQFVPPKVKALFPVLGSASLEMQIRILMPQIHIYGHSHLNRDVKLGNIRYINNAFGYPYETRITRKQLRYIDTV